MASFPTRDPRVLDAMRAAMKAGRNNSSVLIGNIEDFVPLPVRERYERLIDVVVALEREECARTAEFEHRHGTNGIGIAAAIRLRHSTTRVPESGT